MKKRIILSLTLASLLVALVVTCDNGNQGSVEKRGHQKGLTSIEDSVNYILGSGLANSYKMGNSADINFEATEAAVMDFIDGKDFRFSIEEGNELTQRYLKQTEVQHNDSLIQFGLNFLEKNGKRPEVTVLDRGLQYEVIKSGPVGGLSPDGNDVVKLKYAEGNISEGILWTQDMATNISAKDTVSLALNREISGVSQACQYMKIGDKWKVWIPHEIGSSEGKPTPASVVKKYEVMYVEIELLGVIERDINNIPNTREFKGYPGGYYLDKSKQIKYLGD